MYWAFFLFVVSAHCCCASPIRVDEYPPTLEDDIGTIHFLGDRRGPASEVTDLLSAGNTPKKADIKKEMKNASGKTEEGGLYKTYGSDAEGEKGYRKETYSNGDEGYKTFDTFHKRDGDSYGFEKHTSYGGAHGDKKAGNYKDGGSFSKKNDDHDTADTIAEAHYTRAADDHGSGGPEFSHYTGDAGASDHYIADYTGYSNGDDADGAEGPKSYSYRRGTSYSKGEGDDGPYETHSSFSDDGNEDQGDH